MWRNQYHNPERLTRAPGGGAFSGQITCSKSRPQGRFCPDTNLLFNTTNLGWWNLALSQWQLKFIAALVEKSWVDTTSIQILLIFIVTNQLKLIIFHSPPSRELLLGWKELFFQLLAFTVKYLLHGLGKAWIYWIIEGLPRPFGKLLLLRAALRKRLSASGISAALLALQLLLALITPVLGCAQKTEFSLKISGSLVCCWAPCSDWNWGAQRNFVIHDLLGIGARLKAGLSLGISEGRTRSRKEGGRVRCVTARTGAKFCTSSINSWGCAVPFLSGPALTHSEAPQSPWVGRNPWESSAPAPGSAQDHPENAPCASQCCPNASPLSSFSHPLSSSSHPLPQPSHLL